MPATAETITFYLAAQPGRPKAATLQHHLAAISKAHKAAGYGSPVKDNQRIAETMKGIKPCMAQHKREKRRSAQKIRG